jgi:pimeloyl-ACP methyl ester carboxylesterase
VNIAYQVVGSGPIDLVYVMGWVSNLDYFWEEPSYARFLGRLASFSRLILFDKRGTGLSDRVHESDLPTLEQRMDDVRAVLDAVGSDRAALIGVSEGGPMCVRCWPRPIPSGLRPWLCTARTQSESGIRIIPGRLLRRSVRNSSI